MIIHARTWDIHPVRFSTLSGLYAAMQRLTSRDLECIQAVTGPHAREVGSPDDPFNVARMRG